MDEKSFIVTPAKRAFVAEIKQVRVQYKEDPDDQKSTRFSLLPTGEATARVFLVGVIDDIKKMDKGRPGLTAKFRDLTGAITVKAGEYQQQAQNQLKKIKQVPAFVAMTAKINVYSFVPEGKDETITVVSLEPDDLVPIEKPYRLLWNDQTYAATMARIAGLHGLHDEQIFTEAQTRALHEYPETVRTAIIATIDESRSGDSTAPQGGNTDAVGEVA